MTVASERHHRSGDGFDDRCDGARRREDRRHGRGHGLDDRCDRRGHGRDDGRDGRDDGLDDRRDRRGHGLDHRCDWRGHGLDDRSRPVRPRSRRRATGHAERGAARRVASSTGAEPARGVVHSRRGGRSGSRRGSTVSVTGAATVVTVSTTGATGPRSSECAADALRLIASQAPTSTTPNSRMASSTRGRRASDLGPRRGITREHPVLPSHRVAGTRRRGRKRSIGLCRANDVPRVSVGRARPAKIDGSTVM